MHSSRLLILHLRLLIPLQNCLLLPSQRPPCLHQLLLQCLDHKPLLIDLIHLQPQNSNLLFLLPHLLQIWDFKSTLELFRLNCFIPDLFLIYSLSWSIKAE